MSENQPPEPKREPPLSIPLPFADALRAALNVKPPEKPPRRRRKKTSGGGVEANEELRGGREE